MSTRYGLSPWIHQFPHSRIPNLPAITGDYRAPVVIIGAGLTGCATAYVFAAAGVPVVLLEAGRLGRGASGHAAGLLLPDPGPSFLDTERALGLRAARAMFQAWRHAALDGAATLRRLKIPCGLEPCDTLDVVADRDDEKRLRRDLLARTEAGLDASALTRAAIVCETGLDRLSGIRLRDAFGLDPYRASVGLARAARARGARIFERSAVTKVKARRHDVEIRTARATLLAERVIVTTGLATAEFRSLQRHFTPRDTYLALTEPLAASVRRALGSRGATVRDLCSPRRRIRLTGDRLLVAGADQKPVAARQRDATLIQRTGQLMYELLTMYPAIQGLKPEYGWSVTSGDTADGLPYVGPHRNFPRHLFALGAGGDSVTGAFLAARLLLRCHQDAADKADAYWAFTRG